MPIYFQCTTRQVKAWQTLQKWNSFSISAEWKNCVWS